MQGLFVDGRLAGVQFSLREPPMDTGLAARIPRLEPGKEEIDARYERPDDFRRQQMAVNIGVYALTQEGSIAPHLMQK